MNTDPSTQSASNGLARLDAIEAWALHAYGLEAVPPYYRFVRQALLGLQRDGTVIYVETKAVGARLFRRKQWVGTIQDLGKPEPTPAGFVVAKALRLHQARESSFVARIDGKKRIICFTGAPIEKEHNRIVNVAMGVGRAIPHVGELFEVAEWAGTTVKRVQHHTGRQAVATAAAWRALLEGHTDAATLPVVAK